MARRFNFSLRTLLTGFTLASMAVGSTVVTTGEVSRIAFLLLLCMFPTLAVQLGFEGRGARRAFCFGAFLPAASVPALVIARIFHSFFAGRVHSLAWLPGEVRLAIIDGREMAAVAWPFAIVCGSACAMTYWLVAPSQRDS